MKFPRLILFLLLLFCTLSAAAQVGVYGEFSTADLNKPNVGRVYGPTFGVYYDRWHIPFLGAGIDARGALLGFGSTTLNSGLVGPRLVFTPHPLPIRPYVEALIGIGHTQFGQGFAEQSSTNFEYQFLGGLDLTFLPQIDWRVVEFSYGGLSGLQGSFNPKTIGTGIVVRLP